MGTWLEVLRDRLARGWPSSFVAIALRAEAGRDDQGSLPVRSYVLGPETPRGARRTIQSARSETVVGFIPNSAAVDCSSERPALRMSGQGHRGDLPLPVVDLPQALEAHARWFRGDGVPAEVGWRASTTRSPAPPAITLYEGRLDPRPGIPGRLLAVLVPGRGEPRRYSFWAADAIRPRSLVNLGPRSGD